MPDFPPLIYCQDLESFNGTYVNGKLIGKITQEKIGHLLCDGDVIEIRPDWKFRFHQDIGPFHHRDRILQNDLAAISDRYEVTDRILGQGHYGNVYLAHETTAHTKQVACKIINLDRAMHRLQEPELPVIIGTKWESRQHCAQEAKKKILREIRILATLSHAS
jgi:hypothetical protein